MTTACHPVAQAAVVIGYGNTLRGDDGAGPAVANAVADSRLPGVLALALHQLTPELTELLADARLAIFVDAWMGPDDGDVEVLPVQPREDSSSLGHTSDPGELLALTQALYGSCPSAWIIRIPACRFDLASGLSSGARRGVAAAVREVARLVQGRTVHVQHGV